MTYEDKVAALRLEISAVDTGAYIYALEAEVIRLRAESADRVGLRGVAEAHWAAVERKLEEEA